MTRRFTIHKTLAFFTFSLLLLLSSLTKGQTAVDAYGQLSVQGNRIVDQNGQAVQLRGMSLFWSQWQPAYYNYNCVKWLKDDWCINVIRIAMAASQGGYESNPTAEMNKVKTVIDAAIDLGIYVIVDFHDHEAHTKTALSQQFFTEIASQYGSHPNIIYEIFNEPLQVSWSNTVKPYCEQVIGTIRQYDNNNLIICGTPRWSQEVEEASQDPINLPNIAYTLHYYAASHGQSLRNKAQAALNNGIALFVTEYGTCEASGDGYIDENESNVWWDFLDANDIGHCNWSIADKNESASAVVGGAPANGNWSSNQITQSGNLVRNEIKGNCPDYSNVIVEITPIDVPSKLEAEDYHRMFGIQTETTTDNGGGSNVGYIDTGDYIEFEINATQTGNYELEFRVASNGPGSSLDLLIDGSVETSVNIAETGGWQEWTSILDEISLTSGEHTLRITSTGEDWNINYLDVTYLGVDAIDIPGIIEAEEFSNMTGIQTEVTIDSNGGLNVGYINENDWMEYEVNASLNGPYHFTYRLASNAATGQFDLFVDNNYVHTVDVPNTGGWQEWVNIEESINLTPGNHTIRLVATGDDWNINYIEAEPMNATGVFSDSKIEELKVYPTIVKHGEQITVESNSSSTTTLAIIDATGSTAYTQKGNMSTHTIDTNEALSPGMYIIKLGAASAKIMITP